MTKEYTFEQHLMGKHIEEESHLSKDMLVDDFNDWLVRIDVDDIIDYAEEYKEKYKKEIINELNELLRQGHGRGNWRRLLNQLLFKLE